MKRLHVNIQVDDFAGAVRFYTRLFGAQPTVLREDYADWLLEDPRVNLSIGPGSGRGGIRHLGIQAETGEELAELRARLEGGEAAVRHEGETICCYARSDKSWIADAGGVTWELFRTFERTAVRGGAVSEPCCRRPDCCDGAEVSACCG